MKLNKIGISILMYSIFLIGCKSGQIRDIKTINENEQTINTIIETEKKVKKSDMKDSDKKSVLSTLSISKIVLSNSSIALKDCNIRESELTDRIKKFDSKISMWRKISYIFFGYFLLTICIYFIKKL